MVRVWCASKALRLSDSIEHEVGTVANIQSENRIVVLTATRDEERSVALVLSELATAQADLAKRGWELDLLVVDDSTSNLTTEVLQSEAALRGIPITVVPGPGRGIGAAFTTGMRYAVDHLQPMLLATMDCDGQHDATQLPDLVDAKLSSAVAMVIGSRFTTGSKVVGLSPMRLLVSRVGNTVISRLAQRPIPADSTTSFRVFTPEVASAYLLHGLAAGADGYGYFSRFVLFASCFGGCREVPIHFRPRLMGSSKLGLPQCLQFLRGLPEVRGMVHQWERLAATNPFSASSDTQCLGEMAALESYAAWIADELGTWVHGDVLEVGAGTGTMTTLISQLPGVRSVLSVEPDSAAFALLTDRVAGVAGVSTRQGVVEDVDGTFDCIVYVNCLEHIRDDAGELRLGATRLRTGQSCIVVYSPALESIYGELDRVSGHWRRYSLSSMKATFRQAGLEPIYAEYFDLLSVVPYWVSNRLFGRETIGRRGAAVYDRVFVGVTRSVHGKFRPPVGKSVLCVAKGPIPVTSR